MVFASYQSTIIHKTFKIMAQFYVSATDKLLSGWGEATGKTSKFVVACDTEDQVEQIKKWMESQTLRGEHVFGNIDTLREKPYYPPANYHSSVKHYKECNAIHKA